MFEHTLLSAPAREVYTYACHKCGIKVNCLIQYSGIVPFADRCPKCNRVIVRESAVKRIRFEGKIHYQYRPASGLHIQMCSPEKRREYKKGLLIRTLLRKSSNQAADE